MDFRPEGGQKLTTGFVFYNIFSKFLTGENSHGNLHQNGRLTYYGEHVKSYYCFHDNYLRLDG